MNIHKMLAIIFLAIVVVVVLFEALKTYFFPNLGYWESELITIIFSASAAIVAGYFTLKKFEKIINLQKETEKRLLKAKIEADLANKNKSEFLSSMSHELRTPLNAIIGFSDMISSKVFGEINNPNYEDYAKDINKSGHHLLGLINDILDLSKVEAGKLELFVEKVDLKLLVDACVDLVKGRAGESAVRLEINVEQAPDFIDCDMRKLKQVLINLLTNAIKFTAPEGTIS